jgi:flagellar hook protein FlgE
MNLTSLYSGLSGLNANALQLSLIGNNLANVNTPGYKSSSAAFQDLLSQILTGGSSSGNVNSIQVGLGSRVASTNANFSQGSLQNTGINTNVALQGDGFFIVSGTDGVNYTRAGDFHIDAKGNLVTSDGAFVQGYTRRDPLTNQIVTSGPLDNIVIPPGTLFPPIQTSIAKLIANLDADAPNGSTFTSTVQIYDSLGSSHQINVTWTKTGTRAWSYDVTVNGGEVTGGTAGTQFSLLGTPGTMTFTTTGQLLTVNGAPAADRSVTTPTFTNGAAAMTFSLDLVGPNGESFITNYAAPSATSSSTQNGFQPGTFSTMVIGADGSIQGIFGNGQSGELGRIAVATFNNPGGLLKLGGNRYSVSTSSGEPSTGVAGEGGRGTMAGGTLELSNVDMAAEFISMIVAQRGYQANSRIITTTDEILQESLNLKR